MPRRGRPRKRKSIFSVQDWIEYTSDSDSDHNNVQQNGIYEILQGSLRSISGIDIQQVQQEEPGQVQQQPGRVQQHERDRVQQGEPGQSQQEEPGQVQLQEVQPMQQVPGRVQQPLQEVQPMQQVPGRVQQLEEVEPMRVDEQLQEDDPLPEEELHFSVIFFLFSAIYNKHGYFGTSIFLFLMKGEDLPDIDEEEDYDSIFNNLRSQWLLAEIDHSVSKTASDTFWKIGLHFFPKLSSAYGRRKKTPQFSSTRKQMYDDLIPTVDLKIAYRNRDTGDVVVVNETITPRKRFPATQFEKLYETGSVKVCLTNIYFIPELKFIKNIYRSIITRRNV